METNNNTGRNIINFSDDDPMLDMLDDAIPTESADIKRFREIVTDMTDTYIRKNNDYGNAFEQSVERLGLVAGVTPIFNKCNRLIALATGTQMLVKDEALTDTLSDMATYCIMLKMALEKRNGTK